jgi:16S rRNA U1498 N3-methylase RsmE
MYDDMYSVMISIPKFKMDTIAARASELGIACSQLASFLTEHGLQSCDITKIEVEIPKPKLVLKP